VIFLAGENYPRTFEAALPVDLEKVLDMLREQR
jgi:hypothetical protein